MKQNIIVYTIAYNEELMMPYFLRHYSTFADKIVVYDNDCTDNTIDIVKSCNTVDTEIKKLDSNGEFNDYVNAKIYSNCYKKSAKDYDWIIVVDADEFIYNKDIRTLLENYNKASITLPKIVGYDMISMSFLQTEKQIYDVIKTGIITDGTQKQCVFSSKINLQYTVGRHKIIHAYPDSLVKTSETTDIKLLHYSALGVDYIRYKRKKNGPRLSSINRQQGLGTYILEEVPDTYLDSDLKKCITLDI